jgi:hypothetical protein
MSDDAFIDPLARLADQAFEAARAYRAGERGSAFERLNKAYTRLGADLLRASARYQEAING